MLEATRKYLDDLPKMHYEDHLDEYRETDIIYQYFVATGDFGIDATIKIATDSKGNLMYYFPFPDGQIKTVVIPNLQCLIYDIGTRLERLVKRQNVKFNPLKRRDPIQRKLATLEGESIIRYHLVRANRTEYEIVT